MKRILTAGVFIMLLLAGCGGGAQTPETYIPLGTITREDPADWGTLSGGGIPEGCVVVNNVWNKDNAPAGISAQTIFQEDIDGEAAFGWSWQWPANNFVLSYPELVYGTKPWDMGDNAYTLDGPTPFKAGTKTVTANFDIRIQATGTYNMAFSFWVTADPNTPQASISHEIMIWNVNHGMDSAGSIKGQLTVDGVTYDIYVNPNHDSGGSTISWTYIAFVARQPILSGSLNLSAFINYLLNHGELLDDDLTDNDYITSIEFGNEVVTGRGMTEIRNFSLVVK